MPNRINDKIHGVKEVRLVGDNVEQGIYPFEVAMRMADDQNLDLVEISASAVPPVCRILDYQKFLYQKKRKEKECVMDNIFDSFDNFFGKKLTELSQLKAGSDEIARQLWVIFLSFVEAGFSREEALDMTKFIMAQAINISTGTDKK